MKKIFLLSFILIFMGCTSSSEVNTKVEKGLQFPFENGISMSETSVDPMGN